MLLHAILLLFVLPCLKGQAPTLPAGANVLEMLQSLPALPKVHYSWPFCHMEYSCTDEFMATALPWSDPKVMKEYARITRSVSTYASPTGYGNLTDATVDALYEKLAAGVDGVEGASIAVQMEIGKDISPAEMVASLKNATASLRRANSKLGTNATIGAVMVDQEGWGSWDPAFITAKNDAVYNASAEVFGPDVNIQYYGRGLSDVNDDEPSGYWDTGWYTLNEIDDRQLSTSLYLVPERSSMRLQFQRTLQKLQNHSASCEKKKATGNCRWCPDRVVPWISLGAGYHPSENLSASVGYHYQIPWDYPEYYSWLIGRDVNNASARPVSAQYYEWAKEVALYPSPWDQRSPVLPESGGLTAMLLHFIAYCRGAAGIKELPRVL